VSLWRLLIGRPLPSSEMHRQQIVPVEGLSALSLDALTSVAYGPEAIVVVLATAGAGAIHLLVPLTVAIVVLLVILVVSYRQVIDAYPNGGGAYAVARANLGHGLSQLAAGSLIVDYVLTVAVSVAAGVAALTSAFPSLVPDTVPICLAILAFITVLNLRGLSEAARAFLLPTLVFIAGIYVVIFIGLVHPLALHVPQPGRPELPTRGLGTVGILLVLKAFSAGCSALTGVEAIANGTPLFREPRVRQAKRTELLLGVILGTMLLGLAALGDRFHVVPRSSQTVLSQILGYSVGRHWLYYVVDLTTTVVLALAANTSFGGLPVLTSLLARDNYLPHAFALRGDRQTFSKGIWVLAVLSGALLVAVGGDTDRLIPLFAIGVFTGFTLAQGGLVVHWARQKGARWARRAAINGLGAVVTAVATVVFLFTKFLEGAWVVVLAVPAFILLFHRVRAYYTKAARELRIGSVSGPPSPKPVLAIVPVTSVSLATRAALAEALSLGDEVVAVHVQLEGDNDEPNQVDKDWTAWDPGVLLVTLHSPYASVVRPLVEFIDEKRATGDHLVVVLIPAVVPRRFWHRILHNQLDLVLKNALRERSDVLVGRVRTELHD
jgi:amino acid transporter